MDVFSGDIALCLERWSSLGLQGSNFDIEEALDNMMAFAMMANFVGWRVARDALALNMSFCELVAPVDVGGVDVPTVDTVAESAKPDSLDAH